MIGFKQYTQLIEGKYPLWLRMTVGGLVMKISNLSTQIQNEKDPQKQIKLISQQNSLISYISGLGIGVGYQLALDFIEHASTFSTVIAFILPNGFKKERVHRKVPSNFCKLMDMDILGDSFTFKGKPYDGHPCVWQIYMKRN